MRTLTEKYLGGLEIKEDVYKVDLAVLDRYQSFSAELLRLSLLGITGYGFLITNAVFKASTSSAAQTVPRYVLDYLLPIGVVVLALSAMSALGHRYFSTDCITHYVRRIRQMKKRDEPSDSDIDLEKLNKTIENEELSLLKDLNRCRWLLLLSVIFLIVGAVCVAWSFAATISFRN